MTFLNLKLKFIFNGISFHVARKAWRSICHLVQKHIEWDEAAEVGDINIVFKGSLFVTGPKVLRGRETSMLWFGVSGVWMAESAGDDTKAILVRKLNYRVYHALQALLVSSIQMCPWG